MDVHRRRSWARLLRRIYEVDPLVCPCGGELKIISVITDPVVVEQGGMRAPTFCSALPSGPGGSSSHWGKSAFSPKPPRCLRPVHRRQHEAGARDHGLNRRAKCSRRGRRVHCWKVGGETAPSRRSGRHPKRQGDPSSRPSRWGRCRSGRGSALRTCPGSLHSPIPLLGL